MILVTGAMGRIGTAAVDHLTRRRLSTRALVPSLRQVPWLAESGAELVTGDCDDLSCLDRALEGVTAVILISRPMADHVDLQRRIIDQCHARGIRRVVKLSVAGAREASPTEAARWHWLAEEHLRATVAEPCVVSAGRTMQDLLHQTPLLLAHHMLVGCQGNGVAADVDARDVGAVLAGLATASAIPDNTVLATGPHAISRQEVAAIMGQALGLLLRYVACTPAELRQVLVGAGISAWQADDLVSYEAAAADGHWQAVTDVVSQWTGRPAHTFGAFAAETAASLRYVHHLPQLRGSLMDALPREVALSDA